MTAIYRNGFALFLSSFVLLALISTYVSAITVERMIEKDSLLPGELVVVRLKVTVTDAYEFYAIDEVVPEGFIIIDTGGGSGDHKGHIKWTEFQNPETTTLSYVVKGWGTAGDYEFRGEYASRGMDKSKAITGDTKINLKGSSNIWFIVISAILIVLIIIAIVLRYWG